MDDSEESLKYIICEGREGENKKGGIEGRNRGEEREGRESLEKGVKAI